MFNRKKVIIPNTAYTKAIIFCLFYFVNTTILAQSLPFLKQWDARFGGYAFDQLTCIKKTLDGGYILGGSSYSDIGGDKTQPNWDPGLYTGDYWIVKTDSLGIKQWDKRFGGDSYEQLISIVPTADKGYLLAGSSYSQISGDKTQDTWNFDDYWTVKIDSVGNKLWDKRYGGNSYDDLAAVALNPDGSFLLGGWTWSDPSGDITEFKRGGEDYWIIKVNKDGDKLWNKRFGGLGQSKLKSIASTPDGGYLLGGDSRANAGFEKSQSSWPDEWNGFSTYDYWVVRIDGAGNKLWDRRFGGTAHDYLTNVIANPDGSFLLGGYTSSNISGDVTEANRGFAGFDDYWIVKIDASGNKIWDKRFGGPASDDLGSVERSVDGGYFLGGYSGSWEGSDKTTANCTFYEDFWLVRTDANGNKLWDRSYGGDSADIQTSLLIASDGGLLVGGYSSSNPSCEKSQPVYIGYDPNWGNGDYWILKLANSDSLITQNEDKDGLNNYEELVRSTDPKNFDTNNDGLADGVNVFIGLPPLNTDTDGDAISNILELIKGTCPILSDTDGDGVSDALDPFPLDRFRKQLPPINLSDHVAPVITLQEPSI